MHRVVEIRTYRLKPGTKSRFHDLVAAQSIPLLARWGVDVVTFGPSCADDDGYVLIRAYADAQALRSSQDAFYGSAEWREGPRRSILDLIEDHSSVVIELEDPAINALRTAF
jgi:NIPSNAP